METIKREKAPLRIVQACDLQAGGITSLILSICERLDRERVNFDYLVYRNQEEFGEKRVRELGGKKLAADNTDAPGKIGRFLWKFYRTYRVLKREKAQVFHINAPAPYDCLMGMAARLAGVKTVILHSHNSRLKKAGMGNRIFQQICRLCMPLCGDYYLACSDLAGRFLYGNRPAHKVIYIKNGIDTELFRFKREVRQRMRREYGMEPDTLLAGSVGRLCRQKNQGFLLDVFAEVKRLRPDARFLLIGQGELDGELTERAKALGIHDSLLHIGCTDRVNDYLCMMDVFLLPSLHEGLPVAGVEAQACGLPCLFSDSITAEAGITDRAVFLSLGQPAEQWALAALGPAEKERERYADIVRDAGYEIADTAGLLERFYLNL